MPLTFGQLREANVRRCEESYHPVQDWSAPDWLMCVAGELGELAHLLKDCRRGEPVSDGEIASELADVTIYLDLLAARLGVDLGSAIAQKFNATSRKAGSPVMLPDDGEIRSPEPC